MNQHYISKIVLVLTGKIYLNRKIQKQKQRCSEIYEKKKKSTLYSIKSESKRYSKVNEYCGNLCENKI